MRASGEQGQWHKDVRDPPGLNRYSLAVRPAGPCNPQGLRPPAANKYLVKTAMGKTSPTQAAVAEAIALRLFPPSLRGCRAITV